MYCCTSVLCWYNRPETHSVQLWNLNYTKTEINLSSIHLGVSFSEQKHQETILWRFLQTTVITNETSLSISKTQTHKPFLFGFSNQQGSNTWNLHNLTRTLHNDWLIYLNAGNTCLQQGAERSDLLRNTSVANFKLLLVFWQLQTVNSNGSIQALFWHFSVGKWLSPL